MGELTNAATRASRSVVDSSLAGPVATLSRYPRQYSAGGIILGTDSQNVRLIMMLWLPKWLGISHWSLVNSANGSPKVLESAVLAPFLTAAGTLPEFRSQNQTAIEVDVRSMTYQPPPLLLKLGPYEAESVDRTPHPEFPLSAALQSLPVMVLDSMYQRAAASRGTCKDA